MKPNERPLTITRTSSPDIEDLSDLEKRNRLANLLSEAAEIEHNVMCLYLFAAVSMKKRVNEGVSYAQIEKIRKWEAGILMVARQEMEHLAIANNLLTAIGESPNLRRPNYPFDSPYKSMNVSFSMEPFDLKTMLHFVLFEMPAQLSLETSALMKTIIPGFNPADYDGIFKLYSEIKSLFKQIPENLLFVGPPEAQFTTGEIVPGSSILGIDLRGKPRYSISIEAVVDKKSAKKSIQQIIDEGEGSTEDHANSHFAVFLEIYKELSNELEKDPGFQPARRVVSNPKTNGSTNQHEGVNVISNSATKKVSELFDLVYETQILFLMRYFTHTDESESDLDALQYAVFFPMMTTMVRPLAEILTELPAFDDPNRPGTAGPSFTFERRLEFLPHKKAAWHVLQMQLELMCEKAKQLCNSNLYPATIQKRLALILENMERTNIMFSKKINQEAKSI